MSLPHLRREKQKDIPFYAGKKKISLSNSKIIKKTHFLREICMATCCATSLRPELHPRSAVDFVPMDWGRQVAPCNDGFGGGVPRPETFNRNGQWWLNSIEPAKM